MGLAISKGMNRQGNTTEQWQGRALETHVDRDRSQIVRWTEARRGRVHALIPVG